VKTLHTAFRVTDLAVSLDFYSVLGYQEVGRVRVSDGATLTMLKFPDEEVVTLELVHRPDGPRTSWLADPDGYRIELVQWPPGHPDGISAADFG
jgi:lactoylglutathione lyase